ncbi:MAG: DEAD/DEAH box helicase [Acidimicrobiales bacterium]
MTTFKELGLCGPLVDALEREGITEPFPIQALTVADALEGRDVCGKARTGSGKTLAFGLPMLQRLSEMGDRKGIGGLILVPTRELAGQVLDVLKPLGEAIGLTVASFYGGTNIDDQISAVKNGVDVAVATPGRLIDLIDRKAVSLRDVRIVVVDEADRMADMGFLPQVEWVMRKLGETKPQGLLFSATLDGQIDVLVRDYLTDPVRHEVESTSVTVEEMVHRFLKVHEMDRVRVVASIANGVSRTIVFVRTKRMADRLTGELEREGVKVSALHGDLRQSARERSLRKFSKGSHEILVATDVAARGIHVDDVDVVIHFDPPEDHKAYLHRSGRTARAGQDGVVVTFVLWNQILEVEKLQKRLRLKDEPIVEVFSNDPRLADLTRFGEGEENEQAAS